MTPCPSLLERSRLFLGGFLAILIAMGLWTPDVMAAWGKEDQCNVQKNLMHWARKLDKVTAKDLKKCSFDSKEALRSAIYDAFMDQKIKANDKKATERANDFCRYWKKASNQSFRNLWPPDQQNAINLKCP